MLTAAAMRMAAAMVPSAVSRVPGAKGNVYLTFDDGPHPEATPWVLDRLAESGAKATFFCLGRQVERHPDLFARTRSEGHAIGHHTWDHPNGWCTGNRSYMDNIMRGHQAVGGNLFRPPYGRIGPLQAYWAAQRFRIVLWDVLAGDFRPGANGLQVAETVLRQATAGSIIVFHDNPRSISCLRSALPKVIEGFAARGLQCAPLVELL